MAQRITGLSVLLILIVGERKAQKCQIKNNAEGRLTANCSSILLYGPNPGVTFVAAVPDDMDENIEVLDMSDYATIELTADALKRYPRLVEIYLRRLKSLPEKGFFDPVRDLKLLDISGMAIHQGTVTVPPSITTLIANSLDYKKWSGKPPNISTLHNLENLHFSKNYLNEFPATSDDAPLAFIDLSNNRDMKVNLLNVSKFCVLKSIDLSATSIEASQNSAECCALKEWLNNLNVSRKFKCHSEDTCNPEKTSKEEAEKNFNECEERMDKRKGWFTIEIILQILIVVALVSSICYLIYKYYRSGAVQSHRRGRSFFG